MMGIQMIANDGKIFTLIVGYELSIKSLFFYKDELSRKLNPGLVSELTIELSLLKRQGRREHESRTPFIDLLPQHLSRRQMFRHCRNVEALPIIPSSRNVDRGQKCQTPL